MTLDQFIAALEQFRNMRSGNGDLPVVGDNDAPVEPIATMSRVIIRRRENRA